MPQKIKHKGTASRTGKGAATRSRRQKVGSKRRWSEAPPPAVIADSVYSLKLKDKSGAEVFFAKNGDKLDLDGMGKAYEAAWIAYKHAAKLIRKEAITFNPMQSGLSLATSIFMALDGIKKMIPRDFEVNIDFIETRKQGNPYDINIFKTCPWNWYHHYIEVGPTLLKLKKTNKPLHELFIAFLHHLNNAGLSLWCEGMMGSDLEYMEDRMLQYEGEDETLMKEYQDCIEFYNNGHPAKYQHAIREGRNMSIKNIMTRAQRFKAGEPISNLIFQGCHVLLMGYSLQQFSYYLPHEDYYLNSFLELGSSSNIIWESGDILSCDYADTLQAMAQEGVQQPTIFLTIDKNTKTIDFDEMEKKARWPLELENLLNRAEDIIEAFIKDKPANKLMLSPHIHKDERKNRNAA